MFNKDNWAQPINKNDLKQVLLYGFISAILLGIVSGLFNFLVSLSGFQIDLGLVILSLGIATMVNRHYESYHILYAVLTIPMMIVGLFFGFYTLYFAIDVYYGIVGLNTIKYLISGGFYLSFIKAPIYGLISGFSKGNAAVAVFGAINFVIYIFAFYYCYISVARKRS